MASISSDTGNLLCDLAVHKEFAMCLDIKIWLYGMNQSTSTYLRTPCEDGLNACDESLGSRCHIRQ